LIESTSLGDGFAGVQINRMSQRVEQYKGGIYWYPLRDDVRAKFDSKAFFDFMLAQNRKPYDSIQAVFSAIDFVPESKEDFSKLFCSELVAEGYERATIIEPVNASEQTPKDNCELNIFKPEIKITWS
jgi:hypothetical protein